MAYGDDFPHQDPRGPKVAALNLASKIIEYIERANELGLAVDGQGSFIVGPDLAPVLTGLHHVLAGGKVELRIVDRGNPDIVNELDRRAREGLAEATELNRLAGFYLSAGV